MNNNVIYVVHEREVKMSGYWPSFSAIEERALGLMHSSKAPHTTKYI